MNISRSLQKTQYIKAGFQREQTGRIQVSDHVYLYNDGEPEECSAYHAPEPGGAARGLPLKWAALVMALALLICVWMVGSRMALTHQLNQAYADLHSRYQAADAEGLRLSEALAAKSDASAICYYAVQNLGMRLATHEETIGVSAQSMTGTARLDGVRTGKLAGGQ